MSLYEVTNPREVIGGNHPPQTVAELLVVEYADIFAGVDTLEARLAAMPKKIVSDLQDAKVAELGVAINDLSRKIEDTRKAETGPLFQKQKEINGCFGVYADRLKVILQGATALATAYKREKAEALRREQEIAAQKARDEADRQRELAEKAQGEGKIGKALLHDDRAESAADTAFRHTAAAQATTQDLTRVRAASGALSTTRGTWNFAIEDVSKIPLEELRPYLSTDVIEKALRAHVKTFKNTKPIPGVRFYLDEKASFRR